VTTDGISKGHIIMIRQWLHKKRINKLLKKRDTVGLELSEAVELLVARDKLQNETLAILKERKG